MEAQELAKLYKRLRRETQIYINFSAGGCSMVITRLAARWVSFGPIPQKLACGGVAFLTLCNGDGYVTSAVRPFRGFIDSLQSRGFQIDSEDWLSR